MRQFHIGHAAVRLEFAENLAVNGVETGGHARISGLSGGVTNPKPSAAKHYCASDCGGIITGPVSPVA